MLRHGEPPYLECSSRGDKRFSAFYARIRSRGGRSIEEIYQSAKVFDGGSTGLSVKQAKGRIAINHQELSDLYLRLWCEYLIENPGLLGVLQAASGLSDMFGQKGHNCQATALWTISHMTPRPPHGATP
jgi:hypothetical protein